jgi:predicted amidohydrolase
MTLIDIETSNSKDVPATPFSLAPVNETDFSARGDLPNGNSEPGSARIGHPDTQTALHPPFPLLKRSIRIALVQMYCGWAEVDENLNRMGAWAKRALEGKANLVVFPELCISGICKDNRLDSVTESLEGASVGLVRDLACRLGLAIGFGFSERTLGKPYNAYAVVEPDGSVAGVYRKNHIPKLEVPFWQGHSGHPVFRALGRSMAVSICWDNQYPELLAHYARNGAEVVLMPHAWDSDALDEEGRVIDYHSMDEIVQYLKHTGQMRWKTHDQMRDEFYSYIPGLARQGRFWGIFVNQAGRPHDCLQFVGPSFVVDPTGKVVAETRDGEEQLVFADLDFTREEEGVI